MDERDLDPDPLRQFQAWFAEATEAGVEVPEATALATATPDGRPSARAVTSTASQCSADPYARTSRSPSSCST